MVRGFAHKEWHAFWRDYEADPLAGHPFVYTQTDCETMYKKAVARALEHPSLGVFLPDGRPIGFLELKRIDRKKSRCEFGILMQNETWRNQGYGTEALRLLLTFVFEKMGLRRIYADTMEGNERMQHLFDKLGFRYICTDKAWFELPDGRRDRLNYVLTRRPKDRRLRDYALVRKLWRKIRKQV